VFYKAVELANSFSDLQKLTNFGCASRLKIWKEETVVFVRDRVRAERTALGIAGGQNKVVEAVQDEASPTTLPGEPQKRRTFCLEKARACSGLIFQKLMSLAAATRAMDVHKL
jgi:hypothetical protein